MLLKVIKHEFIATGKFLWIVYAASFALCFLSGLSSPSMNGNSYAIAALSSLSFLSFLSISALIGGTFIILCYRYGKNMTGKEAYFTFSLPVKNYVHLLSRIIVAAIYTFLTTAVLFLDIMFLFGVVNFVQMLSSFGNPAAVFSVIMLIVCFIFVGFLSGTISFYAAISFGTVLSKSRNAGIFFAVLIFSGASYILFSFLIIPFSTVIGSFFEFLFNGGGSIDAKLWAVFGIYLLIQIIYCAIYYLICWAIYCKNLRIGER